jgi:hypothetical protein
MLNHVILIHVFFFFLHGFTVSLHNAQYQMPPRRSARTSKRINYADIDTPSYPDGPPQTGFEHTIDRLNRHPLHSSSYEAVDDVLVYCLFSSKRRSRSYRSWITTATSTTSTRAVTAEEGIAVADLCYSIIDRERPTVESCRQAAVQLHQMHSHLFFRDEMDIIEQ